MTNRAHYFSSPRLRYNTERTWSAFLQRSLAVLEVENFFFFPFVFFTNSVYIFKDLKKFLINIVACNPNVIVI